MEYVFLAFGRKSGKFSKDGKEIDFAYPVCVVQVVREFSTDVKIYKCAKGFTPGTIPQGRKVTLSFDEFGRVFAVAAV